MPDFDDISRDSEEHASRRKLGSPPYSTQSVVKLDDLIKQNAEQLSDRLLVGAATSPSGTVDAFKLCGLFSFEVICQAGFAKAFTKAEQTNESAIELLEAMDGSAFTLISDSIFPFLTSTGLGLALPGPVGDAYRKRKLWRERSRQMVDDFLQSSSNTGERYLLTSLATGADRFLGRKLTHEELVEESMNFMFAGSGTTSTTLTYLLYAISRRDNLHIQARLRKEISDLPLPEGTGIGATVGQNPYANAVIKETFRCYPTIISTLPRQATEPIILDEYCLPRGTIVGMQNWVHHRDPAVFPEPDCFKPERWLESTKEMESSLTPFSIGRRNCVGQNLAWQELYWALFIFMRRGLEFTIGPEMENWEMDIEDRFNIAPRGKRLMLEVRKTSG